MLGHNGKISEFFLLKLQWREIFEGLLKLLTMLSVEGK